MPADKQSLEDKVAALESYVDEMDERLKLVEKSTSGHDAVPEDSPEAKE